jgi:hypothetical protein
MRRPETHSLPQPWIGTSRSGSPTGPPTKTAVDHHPLLVLADKAALASEELLLPAMDLREGRGRGIRVVARQLWAIENR